MSLLTEQCFVNGYRLQYRAIAVIDNRLRWRAISAQARITVFFQCMQCGLQALDGLGHVTRNGGPADMTHIARTA